MIKTCAVRLGANAEQVRGGNSQCSKCFRLNLQECELKPGGLRNADVQKFLAYRCHDDRIDQSSLTADL